jgi:sec-independent protein translocase protein TatB
MSFIGTQELLMILVVALVVVGPKRLPDLAKNLGKGIRNFKKTTEKMRSELKQSGAMDDINELKEEMQGLKEEIKPLRGQISDRLRHLMEADEDEPGSGFSPPNPPDPLPPREEPAAGRTSDRLAAGPASEPDSPERPSADRE